MPITFDSPRVPPRVWTAFLPGREGRAPARATAGADRHDVFRAQRMFGSLDGLRALSILAVIWHHAASGGKPGGIWGQGNKGVTLFFVISGFLIVTLLLRAKERGTLSLARFWGRRMCRIFPVYYVALAAYVVGVAIFERDLSVRAAFFAHLPAFVTFTSNWLVNLDAPRVIFFFAWSLAAEEQFYLCWPWLERALSSTAAIGVAGAALVVTQAAGFAFGGEALTLPLKILTSVPAGILLGVILAHTLHGRRGFRFAWRICGQWWSAPCFALLTLLALAVAPLLGDNLGGLLAAMAMTPLVGACVIREDHGLASLLKLRALAWIGTVSYGMYLMHMVSVRAAHAASAQFGFTSPLLDFLLGAIVATGLASLSYVTLEKYFLRRKEKWFSDAPMPVAPARRFRLPLIGSLFP